MVPSLKVTIACTGTPTCGVVLVPIFQDQRTHPLASAAAGPRPFAELFRPLSYPVETGPLVRLTTPGVQPVHPNVCPATGMCCTAVK